MKKKNSKKSSKQLITVLAILATFSVLFAGAKESKISFRQTDFVALPEMTDQGLGLALPEKVAGEQVVAEQPIYGNGSQVEQPISSELKTFDLQINNVAFTANGVPMEGNLQDGFILYTDRDPHTDYSIRFTETTATDPELLDTPYPLYLTRADLLPASTTSTTLRLQDYYNQRNVPQPFLSYLLNALPGADNQNAFAFITREQPANDVYIFLADGAKTTLSDEGQQYTMTIPGDFPLGTYYIDGPAAIDHISFKLIIKPTTDYCTSLVRNIKIYRGVWANMYSANHEFDLDGDTAVSEEDLIIASNLWPHANINGDKVPGFNNLEWDAVDISDVALAGQMCSGQLPVSTSEPTGWCGALLQGMKDKLGTRLGDANYSEIYNLVDTPPAPDPKHNSEYDHVINLSDVPALVALGNNQDACQARFNLGTITDNRGDDNSTPPSANNGGGSTSGGGYLITTPNITSQVLGEKIKTCKVDQDVVGQTKWADGSLIRGCDNKVYRIENQVKHHISSLKDLFKYIGQRIYNVTDEIVALF